MLNYINANAEQPKRVTLLSKPGCSHCTRAKQRLSDEGIRYESIELGSHGISFSSLVAISGNGTTPQVFVDGQCIGGADELEQWLAA